MKKHCKFNSTFRQNAVRVAETLGLEFTSTPRQVKNGTLSFYDPQGKCTYSLYESGYVRRSYYNEYALFSHTNVYQLNRTRFVEKTTPNNYTYKVKERIMANPDEQLGIFTRSVINWRSYEN